MQGQGQGPPGSRPTGPPQPQPGRPVIPQQQSQPPSQQRPIQPSQQQQPVPVLRKSVAPPPPAEEDEIEDEYDDDDFADDFEEDDTPTPKRPTPASASVTSSSAYVSSTPMPNAAAVAQMVARENQALSNTNRTQFATGPATGGVLSASNVSNVPQRKYVPLPNKASRLNATHAKELTLKNQRARKILQQVSLTVERLDDLFVMDPISKSVLVSREKQSGRLRDMPTQYNDDWLDEEIQTDGQDQYTLGVQAPDDLASKVILTRSSTSTSTSTGTDLMTEYEDAGAGADFPLLTNHSTARLASFLTASSNVIEILLSESTSSSSSISSTFSSDPGSLGALSSAKVVLSAHEHVFGHRCVRHVAFLPTRNQSILIAFGKVVGHENENAEMMKAKYHGTGHKGLILLYDLLSHQYPSKVLLLDGTPSFVYGDTQRSHIIFAGTEEGSVCVWDLREDAAIHRTLTADGVDSSHSHSYVLRQASFSTDCLIHDNHEGPVRKVISLTESGHSKHAANLFASNNKSHNDSTGSTTAKNSFSTSALSSNLTTGDDGDSSPPPSSFDFTTASGTVGMSSNFQFASLDEFGNLFVWTGIELQSVDPAGSDVDLGLNPGSKVKVVRTTTLMASSVTSSQQLYDVAFKPDETNEYCVGLGRGQLRRGRRYGTRPQPQEYMQLVKQSIGDDVTTIVFHPIYTDYFLVGYKSGSVSLFHLASSSALHTWWHIFSSSSRGVDVGYAGLMSGVVKLEWSSFRESVWMALDARGHMQVFDIVKSLQKPIAAAVLENRPPTATPHDGTAQVAPPLFALSHSSSKHLGLALPMLAYPSDSNQVEVHVLKPAFSQISETERDKFREILRHVHMHAAV